MFDQGISLLTMFEEDLMGMDFDGCMKFLSLVGRVYYSLEMSMEGLDEDE